MKLLNSEQQAELQKVLQDLADNATNVSVEEHAVFSYWAIELKPKRVRKKNEVTVDTSLVA